MVSQNILIGVAIGLFAVGTAVGYGIFVLSPELSANRQHQIFREMMNSDTMTRWFQQMVADQSTREHMKMSMIQNPQLINDLISDPQFQTLMIEKIGQDHDFSRAMLMSMLEDPVLRVEIIGDMLENQEFREQMQQAMGN
jgi:hypothetical protein